MTRRTWWFLMAGLLACGLCVAGLAVALVVGLRLTAESPEAQRLRTRLEAAGGGWSNVEVRTRFEDGKKVTFAAGNHRLGNKPYSIMLLKSEGVDAVTVQVEDPSESRLVAHWVPPGQPSQTVPDPTVVAHWDELQRLMRQLLEAFQEDE